MGAVWLYFRFDELPARIPIHWNFRGEPDRFVSRTVPGAALPILLGALMCVLLLTTQIGLRRNAPRGALRAPSIRVALAGEYLAAIVCCAAQIATATSGRLLWPALALICAATLAVLAYTFVVLGRAPREPLRNPAASRRRTMISS
ncbi:MAG: DUF1648 domain-containing protein, partial [Myxococcales bacterium]